MSKKSKIEIIKKIKKLMAHERSARLLGNEGEADNFKARIEELRLKHSITQEIRLDADSQAHSFDDYGGEPVFTPGSKLFKRRRVFWEEALVGNLCFYFGCRPVVFRNNNLKIVVGESRARAKVIKSYLHLHAEATGELRKLLKRDREVLTLKEKRLKRESFLHGFSYGLQQRLEQFRQAQGELERLEKAHDVRPSRFEAGAALVRKESVEVREKREEIDRELDRMQTHEAPTVREIDESAFIGGFMTAASCALSDELALAAKQTFDDLREVKEAVRKKREKELQIQYYGLYAKSVTRGTATSSGTTFSGVQIPLIFEE